MLELSAKIFYVTYGKCLVSNYAYAWKQINKNRKVLGKEITDKEESSGNSKLKNTIITIKTQWLSSGAEWGSRGRINEIEKEKNSNKESEAQLKEKKLKWRRRLRGKKSSRNKKEEERKRWQPQVAYGTITKKLSLVSILVFLGSNWSFLTSWLVLRGELEFLSWQ